MKWLLYILLLGASLNVRAQRYDTISYGLNYIEYKGEAVNAYNRHGEPEGKWIEFDTSISISRTVSISCSFGEVRSSERTERMDTTYLFAVKSWGNYMNGLKEGLWQKYSSIDSGNVDRQINYTQGVIDYVKILDKKGSVEIYAVPKPNSNKADCIFYNADGSVNRKQEWELSFLLNRILIYHFLPFSSLTSRLSALVAEQISYNNVYRYYRTYRQGGGPKA